MAGRKKERDKEYSSNWGGAREGTGRQKITDPALMKHTRSFWVTNEEAELLTKYLERLRKRKKK